jgi:16S rRNA (guanine966-N2)-methyltransferase
VAHGFDVVAVGVAHEGAVVAGVVLRPEAGLVQDLGTGRHRGVEERPDRGPVGRCEGDVRFPEALAGRARSDPELGLPARPEPDERADMLSRSAAAPAGDPRTRRRGTIVGVSTGFRVIAGEAGGLRLVAPRGDATRPMTGRAREALFSSLDDRGRLRGARVLDLFAGTGALTIEALSRGAADGVLVDADDRALEAIRTNLDTTHFARRGRAVKSRVAAFLEGRVERPFDLVFVAPPYALTTPEAEAVLGALVGGEWLVPGATVVIERTRRSGPPDLPDGWLVTWSRTFGDTLVVVAGTPAVTGGC